MDKYNKEQINGLILSGDRTNKELAIQLIKSQRLTESPLTGFIVDTLNNEVYFLDKEDEIDFIYSMAYDPESTFYTTITVRTEKKIYLLGSFYLDYIIDDKLIYEEAFCTGGHNLTFTENYQIKKVSELEFKKII